MLVVFTTSGRSENIFRALAAAKDLSVKTIAFLGRDGGKCAGLADVELLVGGKITARIQEGISSCCTPSASWSKSSSQLRPSRYGLQIWVRLPLQIESRRDG